jgi:DNA helicase-2/ATP-dependent DNA helicase PcrA
MAEFDNSTDEASYVAQRIEELIGTPFRDKPESDARGLSYADVAILVRVKARQVDFDKIEHAERPVEIDLGDGVRVSGRIDLIRRRDSDEVVVIDFKSNDRTQQEDVTDLQLRLYALGYKQATGEDARAVVVDNLDDLNNPREEPVTEATLAEASSAVVEAAALMRANNFRVGLTVTAPDPRTGPASGVTWPASAARTHTTMATSDPSDAFRAPAPPSNRAGPA